MATGTLLGALRGYFGYMAAVQGVRSAYKELGESVPTEIATAITAVLEAGSRDAANIVSQLTDLRSGMAAGADASILDVALALVPRVYDETLAWPGGGVSTGLSKVGLGQVAPAVKAAFELGPWLKKAFGWLAVVAAGTVGATLYVDWRRSSDPMYGINRMFELDAALTTRKASELERCAGDKQCEAQIESKYGRMYNWAFQKLIPKGDEECGILDAPTGAMIGGLVGIGFGWSGMRRLMRG